jgi:hypothetical protein
MHVQIDDAKLPGNRGILDPEARLKNISLNKRKGGPKIQGIFGATRRVNGLPLRA